MRRLVYGKPDNKSLQILELTKDRWDHPTVRDAVRDNFRKVRMCRTPALGGEVYASAAGEKVFYHTRKSRCCLGDKFHSSNPLAPCEISPARLASRPIARLPSFAGDQRFRAQTRQVELSAN